MIFRRRRHTVPILNTTSTADISFMLLIFFLVTTSMDVDKGLSRQLPPADKTKQQQVVTNVEEDNLLAIKLDADNKVLVNGKVENVKSLQKIVTEFVNRRGKKHLISLESDRDANYNTYFQIQNELVAAYNTLRNDRSRRLFHRDYALLSTEQKQKIQSLCPQRIAESYANAGKTDSVKVEKGVAQ